MLCIPASPHPLNKPLPSGIGTERFEPGIDERKERFPVARIRLSLERCKCLVILPKGCVRGRCVATIVAFVLSKDCV